MGVYLGVYLGVFVAKIQNILFSIFIALVVGVLVGCCVSLFLICSQQIEAWQFNHFSSFIFMPWALVLIFIGSQLILGPQKDPASLLFHELHKAENKLPLLMSGYVFLSTSLSHLVGASTGREGAIVQMAASFADQFSPILKKWATSLEGESLLRKKILVSASGAAFGAALGAPIAGAVFGMEVLFLTGLQWFAPLESVLASFVAFFVCEFFGAPHLHFQKIVQPNFTLQHLGICLFAGLIFGLSARIFVLSLEKTKNLFKTLLHFFEFKDYRHLENILKRKIFNITYLHIFYFFILGHILILFSIYFGPKYVGLGTSWLPDLMSAQVDFWDPIKKLFMTLLSLGIGFKGGEFMPLAFIGMSLGQIMAAFLPISPSFLAAMGFGAIFSGAAHIPLAASFMLAEIFGWENFIFSFIICYTSYFVSGHKGIYSGQLLFQDSRSFYFFPKLK